MPPASPPWTLLDTNILVYAHNRASLQHDRAAAVLAEGMTRRNLYCVAPQNLMEFVSVFTDPRRCPAALPPAEGSALAIALWASRTLHKVYPQRGTLPRALALAGKLGRKGPKIFDVLLAQTMLDNRVARVMTLNDADFRDVPGIQVVPLP